MKKGWQTKTLGEIADVQSGGTPLVSNKAFWNGNLPWYSSGELNNLYTSAPERHVSALGIESSNAKLFPEGSLLIGMYDTAALKMSILDRAGAFNQAIAGVRPNERIDLVFVLHAINAIRESVLGQRRGVRQKNLSLGKIREIPIPVPPLAEQQRIVGLLDEAFEGLATAKANAEKNLQNARALFESHLQSVFADHWQTGELVTLTDLATDITDGDHLPPPKSPTGVPFITIGNIVKETREIDFSDTFMVPRAYYDALKPYKKPRQGDVLYTVTGSFGIPVIVRNDTEFCFQRHIGLVRPKPETSSAWLYYLLTSPQLFKQATDGATGTAQKTVSLKLLRSFVVPKVPLKQQKQAVEKLDALTEETQRLARLYGRKLAALEALKKSLLHQAFTGEL